MIRLPALHRPYTHHHHNRLPISPLPQNDPTPHPTLPAPLRYQADDSARVHLAVHGRFSLGYLSLAHFPALDFGGEAPALMRVSLAPSLHALTLVVQTKVRELGREKDNMGWGVRRLGVREGRSLERGAGADARQSGTLAACAYTGGADQGKRIG
jgi:hypothetical protein